MPDPADGPRRAGWLMCSRPTTLTEGRLRVTVTGGPAPLGSERGSEGPTVIVAAGVLRTRWPLAAGCHLAPWPRNERGALAGLKTISYAENVRERSRTQAITEATEAGLRQYPGRAVRGHRVQRLPRPATGWLRHAPRRSAGCLLGVTLGPILEVVAAALSPTGRGGRPPVGVLARGDEAFLTLHDPRGATDRLGRRHAPRRDSRSRASTTCLAAAFRDLVAANPSPLSNRGHTSGTHERRWTTSPTVMVTAVPSSCSTESVPTSSTARAHPMHVDPFDEVHPHVTAECGLRREQ